MKQTYYWLSYNLIRHIIKLTYSIEKTENLYLEKKYNEAIDIASIFLK